MIDAFKIFMEKFYREWEQGLRKEDIGLNNSQYGNWSNLKFFGIIRQEGSKRFPTDLWVSFFLGNSPIKTPCAFMGAETLGDSHPARETHPSPRKEVWIGDFFKKTQDQKEKYQQEKSIF